VIQNPDAQGQDNSSGIVEQIAGLYRLIARLRLRSLSVPDDIGIVDYDNTDSLMPTALPLVFPVRLLCGESCGGTHEEV